MLLLKWFIFPILVLAIAALLAMTRWFDVAWVFFTFSVIGLPVMHLWRRATYQLAPSLANTDPTTTLAPNELRQWKIAIASTLVFCLVISLGSLVAIITLSFADSEPSPSAIYMVFTLLTWAMFVTFGAMNILTHHILSGSRST